MRMQPDRYEVVGASIRLDRLIRQELNRIGADHPEGFRVQLYDSVEELCTKWETWIPAPVIEGDCPRSPAIDALASATREALNNAFKWSGTDRISVSGLVGDGEAVAEVRDFGTGFDVGAKPMDIPAERGTTWTIRVPCPVE